ncbi:hypothetical protein SMICM304S_07574 [Streptomyces microflavus]
MAAGRVGGLVVELLGGLRLLLDRREPRGEFGQQTGRLLLVLAARGAIALQLEPQERGLLGRSLQFFMYSSTKTETLARSTHGSKGLEM